MIWKYFFSKFCTTVQFSREIYFPFLSFFVLKSNLNVHLRYKNSITYEKTWVETFVVHAVQVGQRLQFSTLMIHSSNCLNCLPYQRPIVCVYYSASGKPLCLIRIKCLNFPSLLYLPNVNPIVIDDVQKQFNLSTVVVFILNFKFICWLRKSKIKSSYQEDTDIRKRIAIHSIRKRPSQRS